MGGGDGFIVMHDYFVEKLLSRPEILEQQNEEIGLSPVEESHHQDASSEDRDGLGDEDGEVAPLEREWMLRHNHFHTAGYRDGIIAGKEKFAQDGFNEGFKQSVLVGHSWGRVRGITSALAFLPNHLKEKMIQKPGIIEELRNFNNSLHSISTKDVLKLFHEDIMSIQSEQHHDRVEGSNDILMTRYDISDCDQLCKFSKELHLILRKILNVHIESPDRGLLG